MGERKSTQAIFADRRGGEGYGGKREGQTREKKARDTRAGGAAILSDQPIANKKSTFVFICIFLYDQFENRRN